MSLTKSSDSKFDNSLRISDVAALLSVSEATVRNWVKEGLLHNLRKHKDENHCKITNPHITEISKSCKSLTELTIQDKLDLGEFGDIYPHKKR